MATKQASSKKTTAPAKAESKAVATRAPAGAVTTNKELTGALSVFNTGLPKLTQRDIVIPKILPMQPMSKKVTAGENKFGEFIDSLSGTVLGDWNTPIDFIPFHMEKVWIVFKDASANPKVPDFKFHHVEPITEDNEDYEYNDVDPTDKKDIRRFRTMNYYVLLMSEINDGGLPYVVSFRSSSAKAGTKLATTMFIRNLKPRNCPDYQRTPASMVMSLNGTRTTNDKGTFTVMDVKENRQATEAEVQIAASWLKRIRGGGVKTDHSDLEAEAQEGAARSAPAGDDDSF